MRTGFALQDNRVFAFIKIGAHQTIRLIAEICRNPYKGGSHGGKRRKTAYRVKHVSVVINKSQGRPRRFLETGLNGTREPLPSVPMVVVTKRHKFFHGSKRQYNPELRYRPKTRK